MVFRTMLLTAFATAAFAAAQTAPSTAAKPAAHHTAAKPAAHHTAAAASHVAASPALPPGVPPVKGVVKPLITLRCQEIAIGSGPLAEPFKVYRVAYTGYLAADGHKFDASADHPEQPVFDHNLQLVKGEDGKPKLEAGQPFLFQQGVGQVVPGFDQGFDGMHVGGKRRLFIPWQMAYGAKGHPTGDPQNPGIPPKADLIFDVELVDMMDVPQQPHPTVHPVPQPAAPKPAPAPAAPAQPAAPAAPQAPAHNGSGPAA